MVKLLQRFQAPLSGPREESNLAAPVGAVVSSLVNPLPAALAGLAGVAPEEVFTVLHADDTDDPERLLLVALQEHRATVNSPMLTAYCMLRLLIRVAMLETI